MLTIDRVFSAHKNLLADDVIAIITYDFACNLSAHYSSKSSLFVSSSNLADACFYSSEVKLYS